MSGVGRRPDGENRDEQEGTASRRSAGAGEKQRPEDGGCREAGGSELPTREAAVEAVSGGRGPRAEASQCRTYECASQAGEVSPTGDEASAGEVWGRRGRAIWANAGGRTFGERRRDADRRGDAAAMDAGRRAVEPATQAGAGSAEARAAAARWGASAGERGCSSAA